MKNLDPAGVRRVLRNAGYSDPVITAAWPRWWVDDAQSSASAVTELQFALSRNLGFDPRSFFDEDSSPRFVWCDEARFKHLATADPKAQASLTSFGMSIAGLLVAACPPATPIAGMTAASLRQSVLANQPFVRLVDLLSLCWTLGHPVIHLRLFPMCAKRMAAMTVRMGNSSAILLGKDAQYPAWIAFYVAHEIGHIALGHLSDGSAIIDMDRVDDPDVAPDEEEYAADRFALELLTGNPDPTILPSSSNFSSRELARSALAAAKELSVEPGTLALCIGHATGDWARASAALPHIYDRPRAVWSEVNRLAVRELRLNVLTEESRAFFMAVINQSEINESDR